MQVREWTFLDKAPWGDGPWQTECDKRQWPDRATGMPCLMLRKNEQGHWCGYVGVEPGHPLYGIPYNRCALRPTPCVPDEGWCDHTPNALLDVHGGLTFAGACQEHERGICHVPDAGEEDRVWWFGWDACHSGDYAPGLVARLRSIGIEQHLPATARWLQDVYRPVSYVVSECQRLAVQLDDRDFAERLNGATMRLPLP